MIIYRIRKNRKSLAGKLKSTNLGNFYIKKGKMFPLLLAKKLQFPTVKEE